VGLPRLSPSEPSVDLSNDYLIASDGPNPEFVMTPEDLRRIAVHSHDALGLEIGEHKRQMVYSRLSRRLRALKLASFSAYIDLLEGPAGVAERELFANALTTNLTAFFREMHHFTHFEQQIRHLPAGDPSRRLRVWSAGCSTGEEAYSLAMILHTQSAALVGRDCRILATDLDTEVLESAERGIYTQERLRGLPARFRTGAYLSTGSQGVRIVEPVRQLVAFRPLNLIGEWPFKGSFDFIFCRNVLIYFSPETKARVVEQMVEHLRPGGLLYLGHSETLRSTHAKLTAEGHTIYRRVHK
jgi:chemotaxis protein methyltransferase CheR